MNWKGEPEEISFRFRLVAHETIDALEDQHARARADYGWKRDLMEWLATEGKDPDRLRGYAQDTLRQKENPKGFKAIFRVPRTTQSSKLVESTHPR